MTHRRAGLRVCIRRYADGMRRITVSLDDALVARAEADVAAGRAPSVSAWVAGAIRAKAQARAGCSPTSPSSSVAIPRRARGPRPAPRRSACLPPPSWPPLVASPARPAARKHDDARDAAAAAGRRREGRRPGCRRAHRARARRRGAALPRRVRGPGRPRPPDERGRRRAGAARRRTTSAPRAAREQRSRDRLPLDVQSSRRVAALAAAVGATDVFDGHGASIALERDARVATSDPDDLAAWA